MAGSSPAMTVGEYRVQKRRSMSPEPRRDLARQQQVVVAAGVHRAGARGRGFAVAPEQIAADRPLDRTAGILGDDQPVDGVRFEALLRFEPDRQAERDKAAV